MMTAWLIYHGISEDRAWDMPDDERWAYSIAFGEFEGGEWDREKNRWKKKAP